MSTVMDQKTIVVTGATSGIGLALSELLSSRGVQVIGVGRSPQKCREIESHLQTIHPEGKADVLLADLSARGSVIDLCDRISTLCASRNIQYLDGLVNNAGTFTYWLTYTVDGIETQWAVNHFAPFILTNLLLPLLQSAPMGRVITVSSESHRGGRLDWQDLFSRRHYNGLSVYQNTKLANILFSQELNRRLGDQSTVTAFAADPGLVQTDIGMKQTPGLAQWLWRIRRAAGVAPEVSAAGFLPLLTQSGIDPHRSVYWKEGNPKAPRNRIINPDTARRLWEESERISGIKGVIA